VLWGVGANVTAVRQLCQVVVVVVLAVVTVVVVPVIYIERVKAGWT